MLILPFVSSCLLTIIIIGRLPEKTWKMGTTAKVTHARATGILVHFPPGDQERSQISCPGIVPSVVWQFVNYTR